METDLDDTHLCIKCKTTILGLNNYIEHRKKSCGNKMHNKTIENKKCTLENHAYNSLVYNTSPSSLMNDKARKRQDDSYDLPSELGADVFFSSLKLQSVESLHQYQRQKSAEQPDWQPLQFHTTDSSESDDESEDEQVEPAVPATHTGGKWQPEYRSRYSLRVSPYVSQLSPNWDYHMQEEESFLPDIVEQHPPAHHTRGKWVPGSKMQLDYKQLNQIKFAAANQEFWCNICCRKLKGKTNYEHHLNTNYHRKRAQPEQLLEKAQLEELQLQADLLELEKTTSPLPMPDVQKRTRRKIFFKCELCKHKVLRHLTGKHLISHFHYRCMQTRGKSDKSLNIILDNMHWIVLQSPFQCRPCHFYANTEENFLQHWQTRAHEETCSVAVGKFWCYYCQFECDTNGGMLKHLLSEQHKEVLLVINRSVPVCISKKVDISCSVCQRCFRYNVELRKHQQICHGTANLSEIVGTASDIYQSRHVCKLCGDGYRSKMALQRHQKYKHNLAKYFCAICDMEFNTALHAKRHRKTVGHKQTRDQKRSDMRVSKTSESRIMKKSVTTPKKTEDLLEKEPYYCLICGKTFAVYQALGRHTRKCQLKNDASSACTPLAIDVIKTESGKVWQCIECEFNTSYESELLFHGLYHLYGSLSTTSKIKCPLCPKSFIKNSLRCHLRIHTKETFYVCHLCDAKFVRRHNMKEHMKNLHNETTVSLHDSSSKQHMHMEMEMENANENGNENEKFSCKFCKAKFSTKDQLQQHMLENHQTQSEEYFCSQCPYKTNNKYHLNRHSRSHSSEEKVYYLCDKCNFQSCIKSHVTRHMRTHTGEKPYMCSYCDFRCGSMDNLRKHILKTNIHPGGFVYECAECPNSKVIFKTNCLKKYKLHLKRDHSN